MNFVLLQNIYNTDRYIQETFRQIPMQNIKNINSTLQNDMQDLSCKVFALSESDLLQRQNRSAVGITLSTSQSHWYLNGRMSGGELNYISNSSWSVISSRNVLFHIIRITW